MKIRNYFFLSLLLLSSAFINAQDIKSVTSPKSEWDIVYSFSIDYNELSSCAVATDGNFIYVAEWLGPKFRKYDMDCNFIEQFEIENVFGIHDLAYDGQYFYGSTTNRDMKILDLNNKVLVGELVLDGGVDVEGVRHIAYDPTLDNNNGGFWVGNYHDLAAINKNGFLLISSADIPKLENVTRGSAWDNVTDPENPKLWLFSEIPYPSLDVLFVEFDINTLSTTGVVHDVSELPGFNINIAEAGGACAYVKDGELILAGCSRHRPEYGIIFGYKEPIGNVEIQKTEITNVNIYPNPSNGIFNINTSKPCKVSVINNIGQTIYQAEISDNKIIDLNSQIPGIYFVEIKYGTHTDYKKIVKI